MESKKARLTIMKQLPRHVLPKLTVLIQESGNVSISPKRLTKTDWLLVNDKVKEMSGSWVPSGGYNHWSIPLSWTR